jgi:hypothetical protein
MKSEPARTGPLEHEAEESTALRDVTKQQPVKTQ